MKKEIIVNSNNLMKFGAFAGVVFSIFALLISDMHTVSDLVISLTQNVNNRAILPSGIEFPYWVTGVVASPILVITIFVFGAGFWGAWKKSGDKTALFASVAAFLYGAAQIFAAFADVQYAKAVESLQITNDISGLTYPGTIRGISALVIGIIGGLIMTSFIAIYFHRSKSRIGKTGAILAIISVFAGILVKTMAIWFLPYEMMIAFLLLMCFKSVGITFISGALYQQAVS